MNLELKVLYDRATPQERKLLDLVHAIMQGPLPQLSDEERMDLADAIVKAVEAWQSERERSST